MTKKELNSKNFHEGSIDDILKYMGNYRGKGFKDRIKAFEDFHDPEKHMGEKLIYHADYVVNGHPSDSKNMPGAYNLAHQELDKIAKSDYDKLTKKEDIDKVVGALVDEMLRHTVGKDRLKKALEKLKKKGWDESKIKDFKGRMFGLYFADEEGRPMDPYQLSKQLKGKKKIEIKNALKGISQEIQKSYSTFLRKQMTDHLVERYDVLDMAEYVQGKFDKKGLEHEIQHIERVDPFESANHYATLIKQGDLGKMGYKTKKKAA